MRTEEANRVRWNGSGEPFYEVWYAIGVDPASGDGFWVRYTLLDPLDRAEQAGATAWFAYTCRRDPSRSLAITRHFPAGSFAVEPGGTTLRMGDASAAGAAAGATPCIWDGVRFSGAIDGAARSVSWDLCFTDPPGGAEAHFLMPPSLRRLSDRRATLTIPRPCAAIDGRLTIDGRVVDLARAPGHQAHHWGRERAAAWDWAHCAHFAEDPSAIVEVLSPQLAGGRVKPTFVHLHTRDHVYLCERPGELIHNRSSAGLGWWRFVGHEEARRVEVDFVVSPDLVLPFTYHAPSYAASRCWNTQIGDCLVRVLEGERVLLALTSRGRASAEMHRSDLADLPYESWGGFGPR